MSHASEAIRVLSIVIGIIMLMIGFLVTVVALVPPASGLIAFFGIIFFSAGVLMIYFGTKREEAVPVKNRVGTRINWVKYLKLSEGYDIASGICLFGDNLAVVGIVNFRPSIVLLDKNSGKVKKVWVGNKLGQFNDCLSLDGKLYVIGSETDLGIIKFMIPKNVGTIYVFDSELHVQKKIEYSMDHLTYFNSIDSDGNYLYIAGAAETRDLVLYVEKRALNLEFIKSKELRNGGAYIIRVNPITGELWVVGHNISEDEYAICCDDIRHMVGHNISKANSSSIVVIFDKELRRVKRVEYISGYENRFDYLHDICFDDLGNAYATGRDGTVKFDKYGNITATSKSIRAEHIVCMGNFIYTFTNPKVDGYHRHILCILDSKLKIVEEHILSKNVNANSYFSNKHSYDGRNMYVAGYDEALGEEKGRWVIYSILVPTETVTPAKGYSSS